MNTKLEKLSEKELLTLFQDKNSAEKAFAEIYSRYSRQVWAYCLKITGNNEDANDIFQEVFINFHNAIATGQEISNIKYYLISIARNTFLNQKRKNSKLVNIDEIHSLINDNTADNYILKNEQNELINMAIDSLPLEYKEVFVLRLYQGFTYQEITDLLGIPVSTIKNRIFRIR